MDYRYIGYTRDKKAIKGSVVAASPEAASRLLTGQGYRVLSLKPAFAFAPSWENMLPSLFRVKPQAIVLFSRQLALLIESGTDIVTSLELLQAQASSRVFKKVLDDVISDLRGGNQLSVALGKHPEVFPQIYCRSLSAGERTGSLEAILRQVADYMEKEVTAKKEVKGALVYPVIVAIVAVVVIAVLVTFVLPAFTNLYSSLGAELPLATRMLLTVVSGLNSYGLYILGALVITGAIAFAYIKTPAGRYQKDGLMLRLPLIGRVNLLNELARCCRSLAILFRAGLPLPEIMSLVIESSSNRVISDALIGVQQGMFRGEGLSQPMARNQSFLPMMVQMVRVGEETGSLDDTLLAVAGAYETEAADRTHSVIALIQPAMTLGIGLAVAFIAVSLVSAMYSMYGQMF